MTKAGDTSNNHRTGVFQCGDFAVDLSSPQVMGILNVTPDSFSDGGRFLDPQRAIDHALQMQEEGAAFIDVGGESTRPGAESVSESEELARVLPVIEAVAEQLSIPVSVDTSKPAVMREAVASGASMVNDVMAMRAEGALAAMAELEVPICLMHMQGQPRTMQKAPSYNDVVADIAAFFGERLQACSTHGIERERIVLDPGFGFGKTLEHNLCLLSNLDALASLGCPLLIGLSRKSMFQQLLNADLDRRLPGSIAGALIAVQRGARIVRVHDVWQTVHALTTLTATQAQRA